MNQQAASSNSEGLPDQYVVLLEEVIKSNRNLSEENKAIREAMKSRDNVLNRLEARLQNISAEASKGRSIRSRRSREQKIEVPLLCRRQVRKSYKALLPKDDFPGYHFNEKFENEHNQGITQRVSVDVIHQQGGEERCPWANAAIEVAIKRYFLSLFEKEKRKQSKTYDLHRRKCRKQGRQREKLTRRTAALELVNEWDIHKKGRVAEILTEAAMSSEESSFEDDEQGHPKLVGYKIKCLPWESKKLKVYKKKLDRAYKKSLTKRARDRVLPRTVSDLPSDRTAPTDILPDWAFSQTK